MLVRGRGVLTVSEIEDEARAAGLLKPDPECDDTVCVTCSDEGRLGEVVTASADGQATVRTARGVENVVTTRTSLRTSISADYAT